MSDEITIISTTPVPGLPLVNVVVGLPNLSQATVTVSSDHVGKPIFKEIVKAMVRNQAARIDALSESE